MGEFYNTFLSFSQNFLSFLLIVSIIVFCHEYGHYFFARLFGIKVEEFSIGFGKSLFHWYDKHGTKWKFSIIPAGGYVKMYGDMDVASSVDNEFIKTATEEDKKQSLVFKPIYQKCLVVLGGPLANFLLAFIILAGFYGIYKHPFSTPVISYIDQNGPASITSLKTGDLITEANGIEVHSFEALKSVVALLLEGDVLTIKYLRDGEYHSTDITPMMRTIESIGGTISMPYIGIQAELQYRKYNVFQAMNRAVYDIYKIVKDSIVVLSQMVMQKRSVSDLGGPIRIAQYSGYSVKHGLNSILSFLAILSINLGFINLLPIPLFDGGHLFYYLVESVSSKRYAAMYASFSYYVGVVIIVSLMAFVTWNDIRFIFT